MNRIDALSLAIEAVNNAEAEDILTRMRESLCKGRDASKKAGSETAKANEELATAVHAYMLKALEVKPAIIEVGFGTKAIVNMRLGIMSPQKVAKVMAVAESKGLAKAYHRNSKGKKCPVFYLPTEVTEKYETEVCEAVEE